MINDDLELRKTQCVSHNSFKCISSFNLKILQRQVLLLFLLCEQANSCQSNTSRKWQKGDLNTGILIPQTELLNIPYLHFSSLMEIKLWLYLMTILVFYCCCNTLPQIQQLKMTQIHYLTEVRSPKIKVLTRLHSL